MKKHIYIPLFLFALTISLQAQDIVSISKTEVLTKVAVNNTSIKISEEEFFKP